MYTHCGSAMFLGNLRETIRSLGEQTELYAIEDCSTSEGVQHFGRREITNIELRINATGVQEEVRR